MYPSVKLCFKPGTDTPRVIEAVLPNDWKADRVLCSQPIRFAEELLAIDDEPLMAVSFAYWNDGSATDRLCRQAADALCYAYYHA